MGQGDFVSLQTEAEEKEAQFENINGVGRVNGLGLRHARLRVSKSEGYGSFFLFKLIN